MKIYPHYSHEGFVNSYLVGNEVSREALIIDPGKITGEVIGHIEKNTGIRSVLSVLRIIIFDTTDTGFRRC